MQPEDHSGDPLACPGRERLLAFWLGQMGWDNLEEVATHLSHCPRCAEELRALGPQPDTFLAGLRDGARGAPVAGEPECQRLERYARAIQVDMPATGQVAVQAPSRFDAGPEMAQLPGVLGQYRLLERLGRGGMGAVYKAEHARLKRLVAIKLLPEEHRFHPLAVARFHREMEAIGKLDHPNVIRATDAGEAAGRHFLVMEYCQGLDLGRLAHRLGPLPVAEGCELVRQAALGLQYVHEHGLVHRDIKPSNLLLTPAGQVKVLDLGLARLREEGLPSIELTSTGQAMGTADYMAPEQGIDAHRVDIRADIYSLGCTLYKLLAGVAPFGDSAYDSTVKKFQAHALVPVPPLREKASAVPPELAAVVEKMLAKSPGDRYARPAEVAEALTPFGAGADLPGLLRQIQPEAPGQQEFGEPIQVSGSADTRERDALTAGSGARRKGFRPRRPGLILGVVGLIVLGCAMLMTVRPWERPAAVPQTRAGEEQAGPPVPEALEFRHQYDALERRPVELLWSGGSAESEWIYDGKLNQLQVNTRAPGILGLGKIETPGFRIQITMLQLPWQGGLGLVFGYRQSFVNGSTRTVFQMIQLAANETLPVRPEDDPVKAAKKPPLFRLERLKAYLHPGTPLGTMIVDHRLTAQNIQFLDRSEHTLELIVEDGKGLTSVRLDSMDFPELVKPFVNDNFQPEDYQGDFGVYNVRSSCRYRKALFTLYERSIR